MELGTEESKSSPLRSCWVGKKRSGHCLFGFQGDQRDEEEESQMKKSESEVEVRAGGAASELDGRGPALLQPAQL